MLVQNQKILLAFLDWGLGHATRCMPIIESLLAQNNEISIAGNGKSLQFMKQQFPYLQSFELPDYSIQYNANKNAAWQILLQTTKIYKAIRNEHNTLHNLFTQHKFDVIISDNRYGMYHEACRNIFITHQIAIQAPKPFQLVEPFLLNRILQLISKFDELWIPDFKDENLSLSGKLSHNIRFPIPTKYIGILSRFSNNSISSYYADEYFEVVAVISGVEPQRTHFETQLISELKKLQRKCLLICGRIEAQVTETKVEHVTIINYLNADAMYFYLKNASIIICRSGYSTVMDLAFLKKKAIFIPTPGQTEQEYLAMSLSEKKMAVCQKQNKIDLSEAIAELIKLE